MKSLFNAVLPFFNLIDNCKDTWVYFIVSNPCGVSTIARLAQHHIGQFCVVQTIPMRINNISLICFVDTRYAYFINPQPAIVLHNFFKKLCVIKK